MYAGMYIHVWLQPSLPFFHFFIFFLPRMGRLPQCVFLLFLFLCFVLFSVFFFFFSLVVFLSLLAYAIAKRGVCLFFFPFFFPLFFPLFRSTASTAWHMPSRIAANAEPHTGRLTQFMILILILIFNIFFSFQNVQNGHLPAQSHTWDT